MVTFQAKVNDAVVAEGSTMQEAIDNAKKQGYTDAEIRVKSVREGPRV